MNEQLAQMAEIERTLRLACSQSQAFGISKARSENHDVSESQLRSAFTRIDVNGDGNISRDEILKAVRVDSAVGELLGLPNGSGDAQVSVALLRLY